MVLLEIAGLVFVNKSSIITVEDQEMAYCDYFSYLKCCSSRLATLGDEFIVIKP